MEPFSIPIVIRHFTTGASVTLDMVVDTTKLFPIVPASVLHSIGVTPRIRQVLEIVHGSIFTIDQGEVHFTVEGHTVPVLCIFGPERATPTLGRMVLDVLSLAVDEEHRRLVPVVRRLIEHG